MSKKITVGTALLAILLAVLVTFNITYLFVNNKYSDKLNVIMEEYNVYAKLRGVTELVNQNYIGKIDGNATEDSILRGYIAGIGDKYARYMDKEAYAEFLEEQSASMVGIGIKVEYNSTLGGLLVVLVMPDSPAERVGILPGDLLVAIGDTEIADITYAEATALLKGEAGSSVTVSLIRDDVRRMDFNLTREAVTLLSVTSRLYRNENGTPSDIGYIHISGFDSQTPVQFQKAIADLKAQGATKFIFDLRGNPGGELNSAVKVIDTLLPEGPVVRIIDKNKKETVMSSGSEWLDAKVCVLVNSGTASAGELFTAALMDYTDKGDYDATVIGTTTYGKGTVQSIFRLSDNTAVSISTKMYNPPYSDNYEGIGLTPDIILELEEEAAKINIHLRSDQEDNQIMKAVEVLSGN